MAWDLLLLSHEVRSIPVPIVPTRDRFGPFFFHAALGGRDVAGRPRALRGATISARPNDDVTNSMGVFQIAVDPAFYPLMNPRERWTPTLATTLRTEC